jgi:hypothetical protein
LTINSIKRSHQNSRILFSLLFLFLVAGHAQEINPKQVNNKTTQKKREEKEKTKSAASKN